MKIGLVKIDGNRLIPAYDSDAEKLKKIGAGEIVECEIKKPRNYKFHRKFFALVNMVFQNQEEFENLDHLRKYLVMRAGHYVEVKTPTGKFYEAKSLKFAKMDEHEFSEIYESVLQVIENEWLITSETIERNIGDFY